MDRQAANWDPFPEVGWVSLDTSDNDPLRFWRYVITACQGQQKSLGAGALVLLSWSSSSPFVMPPLEASLTLLFNDLAELQRPQLLVLDDYHAIVESVIHDTLTFFLDHLPVNPTIQRGGICMTLRAIAHSGAFLQANCLPRIAVHIPPAEWWDLQLILLSKRQQIKL